MESIKTDMFQSILMLYELQLMNFVYFDYEKAKQLNIRNFMDASLYLCFSGPTRMTPFFLPDAWNLCLLAAFEIRPASCRLHSSA